MNKGYQLLAGLMVCGALSSCFKDEPLNAECDMTAVSFHVADPLGTFFHATDTLIEVPSTQDTVRVSLRRNHKASLRDLVPQVTVTPGATVSQTGMDVEREDSARFSYVVTSEDRRYQRLYTIILKSQVRTVDDVVKYDFEHYELDSRSHKYYVWHNVLHDGSLGNDWDNGNAGFNLTRGSASPDEYPSTPIEQGYDGHALRLTTRDTGPIGRTFNKRIAAGSFFLGSFDFTQALKDAMRATRFGVPFDRQPVEMTGYYTYRPGETYQDKDGKPVPGVTDEGAVYAVFYRNHDARGNAVTLYGDDVKTSPQIVAIADMGTVRPTDKWTEFRLLFNYTSEVDYDLLAGRGYSLAIVFSSSKEGDRFEGAIGSELCIDKVRVICKKEDGVQ